MTAHEKPLSVPHKAQHSNPLSVRYLWIILAVYVVGFIVFVAKDLYADQVTQGLYNVHRTPFLHPHGNVVDPKPDQTLNQEIGFRLKLAPSNLPSDWFSEMSNQPGYIVERQIRQPMRNEILVGRTHGNETVVVLSKYRGEWVTFRPSIGVLLEPSDPLIKMNAAVIVKVTSP